MAKQKSMRPSQTLSGHTSYVNSIAITADGSTLASAGSDSTVRIWDLTKGKETRVFKIPTMVICKVQFSRDGRILAATDVDETVKLWRLPTWEEVAVFRAGETIAISSDGQTLATSSRDQSITLWEVSTRKKCATLKGHSDVVAPCLAFSPDGQILASGGDSFQRQTGLSRAIEATELDSTNAVKLWDLKTAQEVAVFRGHERGVTCLAFAPDGRSLVSGSRDKSVKVWDLETEVELAAFRGHSACVRSVAFRADGKLVASGGGEETSDGNPELKLWNLATCTEIASLQGHQKTVTSLVFATDGRRLISASRDGKIMIWDVSAL